MDRVRMNTLVRPREFFQQLNQRVDNNANRIAAYANEGGPSQDNDLVMTKIMRWRSGAMWELW